MITLNLLDVFKTGNNNIFFRMNKTSQKNET